MAAHACMHEWAAGSPCASASALQQYTVVPSYLTCVTSLCPNSFLLLPPIPQYVQQANKPGRGYYIQEEMDRIKMENDRRKLEELLRCKCV